MDESIRTTGLPPPLNSIQDDYTTSQLVEKGVFVVYTVLFVGEFVRYNGVVLVRDVLYHSLHWDQNYGNKVIRGSLIIQAILEIDCLIF